jgi:hypothetical protein
MRARRYLCFLALLGGLVMGLVLDVGEQAGEAVSAPTPVIAAYWDIN